MKHVYVGRTYGLHLQGELSHNYNARQVCVRPTVNNINLKFEVIGSSEMLVTTYKTTRVHNPENRNQHQGRGKKLKSHPNSFLLGQRHWAKRQNTLASTPKV